MIFKQNSAVGDTPMVDTAEQVYISSLALLKVRLKVVRMKFLPSLWVIFEFLHKISIMTFIHDGIGLEELNSNKLKFLYIDS